MTRHNGKARKAGERVGLALANRHKKSSVGPNGKDGAWQASQFRHTTDADKAKNIQSVLDRSDLAELMAMADLADKDFTAERGQAVVISTGAVDPKAAERNAAERVAAEARHAHRLRIPRRPAWTPDMTPEQLDYQERNAFLSWRRDLASLEDEEHLVLTPFEKNLEVWRQLWRVLERSDIVVQVVDARDPLLYRSTDLEEYARELHASKHSFILLNKADLLPDTIRTLWADYFDKVGVSYAFWSAYTCMQAQIKLRQEASALGVDPAALKVVLAQRQQAQREQQAQYQASKGQQQQPQSPPDPRIRVLDEDELLDLLEAKAREAVAAAGADDPRVSDPERRLMVGLVGYPNVGKSSTINALFGSKKTAVAATPGKTKHFQTLLVSPNVCLCDCPGLVMPKFAKSRAEMVAAGVIPIDRLTDIRQPTQVVVERVGRAQLQEIYNFKLPPPALGEAPNTPPSAGTVLRVYATLRGWTAGSGLPDETRAGRQLLRDYTDGKLLFCTLPPGSSSRRGWAPEGHPSTAPCVIVPPLSSSSATPSAAAASTSQPSQAQSGTSVSASSSDGTSGSRAAATDPSSSPSEPGASSSSASTSQAPAASAAQGGGQRQSDAGSASASSDDEQEAAASVAGAGPNGLGLPAAASTSHGAGAAAPALDALDAADLELLQAMNTGAGQKQRRPEYKFQKKAARSKGNRGEQRSEGMRDGEALVTGKKGGLVRVAGYV